MARLSARSMAAFLAALLAGSPLATLAYEIPLASDSVREAYFLGQRNDEKTAHFFDPYTKHFPPPPAGPHISQIELLTPYAQVVDRSQHKTVGYSAQDAEEDYHALGDTLVVYVRIEFTATYTYLQALASANRAAEKQGLNLQDEDFWRDFEFGLSPAAPAGGSSGTVGNQPESSAIEPRETQATPIYAPGGGPLGTLAGTVVRLVYDAKEVPSEPVPFEVIAPGGRHFTATFDLSKLR